MEQKEIEAGLRALETQNRLYGAMLVGLSAELAALRCAVAAFIEMGPDHAACRAAFQTIYEDAHQALAERQPDVAAKLDAWAQDFQARNQSAAARKLPPQPPG